MIHSTIDQTAPFENLGIIKKHLRTPIVDTLVVHQTGHNIYDTDKDDKEVIFNKIESVHMKNILLKLTNKSKTFSIYQNPQFMMTLCGGKKDDIEFYKKVIKNIRLKMF